MIEILINKITEIILTIGNLGVFFLMLLESTMAPLPSELVMPFAGFLVALGNLDLLSVMIAATLGSIAGSLISYWLGRHFGIKVVNKFGKFLLLNKEHLKKAEKWFKNFGGRTIFLARFIPGIRHVISIPAGAGKMKISKFILLTMLGAGIWNTFLIYLGYLLEKNYGLVYHYARYIDTAIAAIIIILIVYYISRIIKARRD